MTLVSERKAMVASSVSAARHRAENSITKRKEIEHSQEEIDRDALKIATFDEVQNSGMMTPEQEKILNG
jgi:hypothetical protein